MDSIILENYGSLFCLTLVWGLVKLMEKIRWPYLVLFFASLLVFYLNQPYIEDRRLALQGGILMLALSFYFLFLEKYKLFRLFALGIFLVLYSNSTLDFTTVSQYKYLSALGIYISLYNLPTSKYAIISFALFYTFYLFL